MDDTAVVIPLNELSETVFPNKKRVLVGGCFDVLHISHVRFLKAAKKEGDYVIVALESDDFIKKYKKREPFHTQPERAEIIAALRFVDCVILLPLLNSDAQYLDLVTTVRPHVIAVTEGDEQLTNKKRQAELVGGYIKTVMHHRKKTSSTEIIKFFRKK
jgi:cytidyltransferase-like protein